MIFRTVLFTGGLIIWGKVYRGHLSEVIPEPDTVVRESKDFFSFEVKIHDTLSGEQNKAD